MIWVELGEGFTVQGVQQFPDGLAMSSVNVMTVDSCTDIGEVGDSWETPMINGASYYLDVNNGFRCELNTGWMSSGMRMALGIPLQPNRMSRTDWEQLPGIGPSLAKRIDDDRQNNGEFVDFQDLKRVRGVGEKRLSNWKQFF